MGAKTLLHIIEFGAGAIAGILVAALGAVFFKYRTVIEQAERRRAHLKIRKMKEEFDPKNGPGNSTPHETVAAG
jgi:predicted RND superfamily exporter protein